MFAKQNKRRGEGSWQSFQLLIASYYIIVVFFSDQITHLESVRKQIFQLALIRQVLNFKNQNLDLWDRPLLSKKRAMLRLPGSVYVPHSITINYVCNTTPVIIAYMESNC